MVSLEEVKAHLGFTGDETDDDDQIERLLDAATSYLSSQLGYPYPSTNAAIDQAACLLVAHWYENREATLINLTAQGLPIGVQDIVNDHRNYSWAD